jgi:hypothetical protein
MFYGLQRNGHHKLAAAQQSPPLCTAVRPIHATTQVQPGSPPGEPAFFPKNTKFQ